MSLNRTLPLLETDLIPLTTVIVNQARITNPSLTVGYEYA